MIDETIFHGFLSRQERKWQMITGYVKHIPKEPLIVITKIFKGGDLFLAERLKQEGEHVLLDAQAYWMGHLLPALTEYFGIEEVTIAYDETIPLSPIFFLYKENVVARLSPYWRTFEEFGVPGHQALAEERKNLMAQLAEKEQELAHWMACEENPALLGEDDTWLFAKASLNPKKYKKLARDTAIQKQNECLQIQQAINSVDFKQERAEQEHLQTAYYVERIKSRVERWGDFAFYTPTMEEE